MPKGKRQMESKQNAPNEINNPKSSQTVGGKVMQGPNEGGTSTNPADKKDPVGNVVEKTNPSSIASPSQQESDEAASKVIDKEEQQDGKTVLITSLDQASLDTHNQRIANIPKVANETQALTGVAGNVNLTQSGSLSGDKSVREDRSLEEIHEELNKSAGPNPTPLREGNELLKASNGMTAAGIVAIDQNTNLMADKIENIMKRFSLDDEARKDMEEIKNQLRTTGRF